MSGGKRVAGHSAGQRAAKGGVRGELIATGALLVLILAYFALCAWVYFGGRTLPKTYFTSLDYEISNMTEAEVRQVVTNALVYPNNADKQVELRVENHSEFVGMDAVEFDVESNVQWAMSLGRDNFFTSGFHYLKQRFGDIRLYANRPLEESLTITPAGEQAIGAALDCLDEVLDIYPHDEGYALDMEQGVLTMTKGHTARRIDREDAAQRIREAYLNVIGAFGQAELTITDQPPVTPDFDAIHAEFYAVATEPVYDKQTGTVSDHVVGLDFDVSGLKAAYEKAAEGETFSVPLTVTQPKDTKEAYEQKLFADVLGTATSKVTGTSNRKTNVKLSAAACDGVILLPGEEFSYNNTTGSRSADKGYLPAPTYSAGASVDDVGGGICQTSSTIYYALLHTTLEVVERQNHSYATGYVPDGMDATVFFGSLDFRFKNSTNYPVKVVTESYDKNGSRYLKVTLMGTNEDGRYAKPTNEVYDVVEPTKSYVADQTVPQGTLVLDKQQNAYRGRKAQVTRTIYEADGTVVERQNMGVSRYKMRPHLYHYNPLDGDPASWVNGVPPQPVPVAPVTPVEPVTPVQPDPVPETPVTPEPAPEFDPVTGAPIV